MRSISISIFCSIIFFTTISSNQTANAAAQESLPQQSGMYTSFNDHRGGGSEQPRSPSQLLQRASQLSQDGQIEQALEVAARGYKSAQHDPTFVISYIELLNELATIDGEADKKILNRAIKVANTLHLSKICNGQTDAEMSYHFMVAMGSLADNVVVLNERIASQLYTAQGRIARNLRNNPGYPSASLEVLGQPLVNLAKAHAMKKNTNATMVALTEAFEIGYRQFDAVRHDAAFESLSQKSLQQLVDRHQKIYRQKVNQWSITEIANFQPFEIQYDVAGVDGERISSNDNMGHVTVVDLWATWCQPCREGIPHFIELQKNHANVDVIGISMDDPENPTAVIDTVKNFGIDNGINYKLAVATDSIKKQIPGQVLLPTTLFIDHTGTVRYIARGFHDYDQLSAITRQLSNEMVSTTIETVRH